MIRRAVTLIFCFVSLIAEGQILRDINYQYIYNPDKAFSFEWKVIREGENYDVYYKLELTDTTQQISDYAIHWDVRSALGEKSGTSITAPTQLMVDRSWKKVGKLTFKEEAQKVLVAKVIHVVQKKLWVFQKRLSAKPSPYLASDETLMHSFISKDQPVSLKGFENQKPLFTSYYNDPFPAAAPPFSTAQAKVPKTIKPDSTFTIEPQSTVRFEKKGLYLAQQDTASAEALAFRVEVDYPKLGRLENLIGPLLYICTKQEAEKLKLVGGDKKKFDQLILSITGNTERARIFMRNYYKRIELANLYFTSYKEGWKTDRGMIYVIFGLPDEVYLFEDREVWEYKANKTQFQFVKSASLFDPENFVLIRSKKYTDGWYEMVDLWRKVRF